MTGSPWLPPWIRQPGRGVGAEFLGTLPTQEVEDAGLGTAPPGQHQPGRFAISPRRTPPNDATAANSASMK